MLPRSARAVSQYPGLRGNPIQKQRLTLHLQIRICYGMSSKLTTLSKDNDYHLGQRKICVQLQFSDANMSMQVTETAARAAATDDPHEVLSMELAGSPLDGARSGSLLPGRRPFAPRVSTVHSCP